MGKTHIHGGHTVQILFQAPVVGLCQRSCARAVHNGRLCYPNIGRCQKEDFHSKYHIILELAAIPEGRR